MGRKTWLKQISILLVVGFAVCSASHCGAENGIQWHSYTKGLEKAKGKDKLIFINFHADWCTFCRKMKAETYSDPKVIAYLNENFICINVDSDKEKDISILYFVRSLPTIWFLEPPDTKLTSVPGYVPADTFLDILKFLHTGSYKTMNFKEYMEKKKK